MSHLQWLIDNPIAHRGLHRAEDGIIENSASAVRAALERHYGVEVDVVLSADGEAMVFHDSALERLTDAHGLVRARSAAELKGIALRGSADRLWTLGELLQFVNGRVPLVVEIKSDWDGDCRLTLRVIEVLAGYQGHALVKSFDPVVVRYLRQQASHLPRGIIGCSYKDEYWNFLSAVQRFSNRNLLHWPATRPHAISWDVKDLQRGSLQFMRRFFGVPAITWTVRTESDQARAALFADQMVFEEFLP